MVKKYFQITWTCNAGCEMSKTTIIPWSLNGSHKAIKTFMRQHFCKSHNREFTITVKIVILTPEKQERDYNYETETA